MVDGEQLILEALKDGLKRWSELERALVKSGKMSKSTLSQNLLKLESEGKIRRIVDDSKKPVVVWYALSYFELPLERKVRKAVEKLRKELIYLREPTVKDVAAEVGELPDNVRTVLYKLAPKISWKEQGSEEAEREAEKAINLAGWLKWLQKGEQNQELNRMAEEAVQTSTSQTIHRARKIMENFPEIVPEAKPSSSGPLHYVAAGLEWRKETIKAWQRVFKSEPPIPSRGGVWIVPHNSKVPR